MKGRWSQFRGWVHNLWVDNCEEHQALSQPRMSEREYFQRFRWWLKREYRFYLRTQQRRQRWRDMS